ncbi:MAG TPA: hypothetical protein VKI65_05895 [Gemmataceae bacterium]|nr:hypothetical protein [Gemmataceae bacterium]
MRRRSLAWVLLLFVLLPACARQVPRPDPAQTSDDGEQPADSATKKPSIELRRHQDGTISFAVVNADIELSASANPKRLEQTTVQLDPCPEIFAVRVVASKPAAEGKEMPPLLGSYRVERGELLFTPRFPLQPGVHYRARFNGESVIEKDFVLAKPQTPPTNVVHVYPTRNVLPENLLKFYIHFSAPMSRGEAYRHIRLLDAAGKAVELPFLELGEELWDPDGKRFTLFFDPGRIKRGLKPREETGPALEEGKSYALVVNREWLDAAGNPLKEPFRKPFRVVAPDDECPDPKNWKIEAPAAASSKPLVVTFPEPLDHALLERMIWVTDATGQRINGSVAVKDEETRWEFTPESKWKAGDHHLVVQTTIEDLAGNTIGQPFEVDVFRPIRRTIDLKTIERRFQVR